MLDMSLHLICAGRWEDPTPQAHSNCIGKWSQYKWEEYDEHTLYCQFCWGNATAENAACMAHGEFVAELAAEALLVPPQCHGPQTPATKNLSIFTLYPNILLCGSSRMMHRHFAPGPARITMRSIPTNLTPELTTNTMLILDKIPRPSAQVHTRTATRLPSAIQPPRSPEVGDNIKDIDPCAISTIQSVLTTDVVQGHWDRPVNQDKRLYVSD